MAEFQRFKSTCRNKGTSPAEAVIWDWCQRDDPNLDTLMKVLFEMERKDMLNELEKITNYKCPDIAVSLTECSLQGEQRVCDQNQPVQTLIKHIESGNETDKVNCQNQVRTDRLSNSLRTVNAILGQDNLVEITGTLDVAASDKTVTKQNTEILPETGHTKLENKRYSGMPNSGHLLSLSSFEADYSDGVVDENVDTVSSEEFYDSGDEMLQSDDSVQRLKFRYAESEDGQLKMTAFGNAIADETSVERTDVVPVVRQENVENCPAQTEPSMSSAAFVNLKQQRRITPKMVCQRITHINYEQAFASTGSQSDYVKLHTEEAPNLRDSEATITTVRDLPETSVTTVRDLPETSVTTVRDLPETSVTTVRDSPETSVTTVRDLPETSVTTVRDSPETSVTTVRDLPETSVTTVPVVNEASGKSLVVGAFAEEDQTSSLAMNSNATIVEEVRPEHVNSTAENDSFTDLNGKFLTLSLNSISFCSGHARRDNCEENLGMVETNHGSTDDHNIKNGVIRRTWSPLSTCGWTEDKVPYMLTQASEVQLNKFENAKLNNKPEHLKCLDKADSSREYTDDSNTTDSVTEEIVGHPISHNQKTVLQSNNSGLAAAQVDNKTSTFLEQLGNNQESTNGQLVIGHKDNHSINGHASFLTEVNEACESAEYSRSRLSRRIGIRVAAGVMRTMALFNKYI